MQGPAGQARFWVTFFFYSTPSLLSPCLLSYCSPKHALALLGHSADGLPPRGFLNLGILKVIKEKGDHESKNAAAAP